MRIETALKRRDSGKSALRSLYSQARSFGMSNAEIITRRQSILETVTAKAPEWVSSYLAGYWESLIDGAYERDLCFGGFIGDKFYSTHRNRADYYETNGIEPSAYSDDGLVTRRGHYWIATVDAGQPKPFFINTTP